ncbi:MAG: PEP-CTERM sorting domain-containing protein [Deltaproteobacteria bacterium]|nr:PEP-CTERM sorting domain-containing protein [Deltaproteobacteria bacterium]
MRKWFALVLLVVFSWLGGLGQDARAGVTVDVLFQDGTGSALTINEGDAGPGCSFGGYYAGSVSTGRCMDVVMTTTYDWIGFGTSVTYDSDNGLGVGSMYEWWGLEVAHPQYCTPPIGLEDKGGVIEQFGCLMPPPVNPPVLSPGTYKLGTIIWDTTGTTEGSETIAGYIDDLIDGMIAVIDGNLVFVDNSGTIMNSAVLNIIPEPGTAALLGLGLVGLVLAAQRRRD